MIARIFKENEDVHLYEGPIEEFPNINDILMVHQGSGVSHVYAVTQRIFSVPTDLAGQRVTILVKDWSPE